MYSSSTRKRAEGYVPRLFRRLMPVVLILLVAATALADLPSAEKVMKESIKAMGGEKAIEKHHNSKMQGKMLMSGIELAITVYSAEPNLSYTVLESDMTGKMESGCNGEVAWDLSMMQGASIKEDEELEKTIFAAVFNSELLWKERHESIEVQGVEEVEGKECYKVLLTPKIGDPSTNYYDSDSYRLLKTETVVNSPMGSITIVAYPMDYRDVGDVLVPFRNRTVMMGAQEMVMEFETVEFNVEIPEGTFDLPEGVQELLED